MSDLGELAAVLRRIVCLLSRADADVAWSGYGTAGELRGEVHRYLVKAETGSALEEAERAQLRFLFLPTGPLQEVSVSSGWGAEFLALAARADKAV